MLAAASADSFRLMNRIGNSSPPDMIKAHVALWSGGRAMISFPALIASTPGILQRCKEGSPQAVSSATAFLTAGRSDMRLR
jgi:hypothetical protein